MELLYHTLGNGIRLVHHPVTGLVAHCGLIIGTGSRDEEEHEHGLAHFSEHMLFKGTAKRKAYHILSRLEDVGGELNAYTTKEETVVHASFLKDDYERAIEIISDMVFNSTYPEKEIEKEKDVIIDEINSYLDNPAELIFDDFEELIFAGRSIGHSILGTPSTVKCFTAGSIRDFISRNYNTSQMVFCSVGDISYARLTSLFRKYFEHIPEMKGRQCFSPPWSYKPACLTKNLDTYQDHCIIGNVAYNLRDERRPGMFLLNNILGGQGMNSRLNLSLREKNGLAYNVESSYIPYCDTGAFSIYFGTEDQNLERSIMAARAELDKLRTTRLGIVQLGKARNQIKGYLARGFENHESLMLSLGKSLLVFDTVEDPGEIYRKIDNISSSHLLETANDIFDPDMLSTLIYR
ncbi:MAG TPA: pitrilysin family protein [Bacteroidales bacterium]|jgi:predicted Zn-dependent peptidase|nr:insulinase family protein [Bacteroidales bacterium]HNR41696.1 pitrilysin family protein [Bacteroidales bacterium]HPM19062.1 pitrilysin family protein [Bacteroidales bacterium]HQG78552.1 pitrilysin family protein [Bacteroidales bacterium]